MSYTKIQSVLCCIRCLLSFDWAMPECTLVWKSCCTILYSLLLHGNLDFLLASLSVSYTLLGSCHWTRNRSWWEHLFYLFIYFFYSRSTNSLQLHMGFIYMVIKAYFFSCFLAVHGAEARTFSFLKALLYKVWQISSFYFTVRCIFFLPSVEKILLI